MPSFIIREWNGYKIRVVPNYADNWRSFLWDMFRHELIPYLWGADIIFDLRVKLPHHHDKKERRSGVTNHMNEYRPLYNQ